MQHAKIYSRRENVYRNLKSKKSKIDKNKIKIIKEVVQKWYQNFVSLKILLGVSACLFINCKMFKKQKLTEKKLKYYTCYIYIPLTLTKKSIYYIYLFTYLLFFSTFSKFTLKTMCAIGQVFWTNKAFYFITIEIEKQMPKVHKTLYVWETSRIHADVLDSTR